MIAKHTPGPWKVKRRKHSEFSFWHYSIEHTTTVRDCYIARELSPVWLKPTNGKAYRNKEGLANARLIASAPELLDALKLALTLIPASDETHAEITMITQVIAKAESVNL